MKLLFLFSLTALFAKDSIIDTMVNDPSALIDGKVSAITGHPCIHNQDLVIQGAEPISISRMYIHDALDGYWKTTGDFCIITLHTANYRWQIEEPDECPIIYKQEGTLSDGDVKYTRYTPSNFNSGFSNTSRGEISSKTNLKNTTVLFEGMKFGNDTKPEVVKVNRPNGSVRTYRKVTGSDHLYLLQSEKLSNGNWILYTYDRTSQDKGRDKLPRLLTIKTTNPSQTKIYAQASFTYYDNKDRNQGFKIVGSDGQSIEYLFEEGGKNFPKYRSRIKRIKTTVSPLETLQYTQFKDNFKNTHDRLALMRFPCDRCLCFSYYADDINFVAGKEIHLSDRVGPKGFLEIIRHSGGAMNANYAIKRLPKEMRDRVIFRTIAPAKIALREDIPDVKNYMSSGFDPLMNYHQCAHPLEYNRAIKTGVLEEIKIHPSKKLKMDHEYSSPTYASKIEYDLTDVKKRVEFR